MTDLVADNISKRYGEQQVLAGFSHVFGHGGVTCISGPSGGGKTTLLHILMGLTPPDEGRVTGREGKRIGAVFQEDRLCENLSAVSNVRLVCHEATPRGEIEAELSALGLGGSLYKPARELSGGMKRRVALVRALIIRPDIVFLDEPFKGLDPAARDTAADYLKEKMSGKTVILVSHSETDAQLLGGDSLRVGAED